MPDKQTQELDCSFDELKSGIKLRAGHAVVFVVGGVTGTSLRGGAAEDGDEDDADQEPSEGDGPEVENEPAAEDAAEPSDDPVSSAAPEEPESDPSTASSPEAPASTQTGAASATLRLADADGSEVSWTAGAPLTVHWKVTGAASARLAADLLPGSLTWEGTIGDDGEVVLDVAIEKSVAAKLTMVDDDGTEVEWEFHLDVPEKPESPGATDAAPSTFESLLSADLTLGLDDSGDGEGDLALDPGPGQSATFTLTATPKDQQQGTQSAQVTAKVAQNLALLLTLADGVTPAPAGKTCKLTPILDAKKDEPADGPQGDQQLS